ncbi:hypothetical protein Y032_0124g1247 [Ancylostoma ceylanicum]|uniref:Uncharacterized protein n=1 Tax=Ancylostoma ceylanicum TaxID=53326 RepID=A0A016T9A2_9BILA|nr:hypothetical protein Y032_0124g1247 [Ancylostoma ceylanicum]
MHALAARDHRSLTLSCKRSIRTLPLPPRISYIVSGYSCLFSLPLEYITASRTRHSPLRIFSSLEKRGFALVETGLVRSIASTRALQAKNDERVSSSESKR